jgi:hypothetical protein
LETPANGEVSIVAERDDGLFQIGFEDDAIGPFESRRFAEAVAAKVAA